MKSNDAKSNLSIGFLTIVEHPDAGLFGGYLVLNRLGRPMEFHCTAPIKPSRAQQILYGATLEPYLYGEQIGQTLVGAAKAQPTAIFTDRQPALALRELVDVPVVFVLDRTSADSEEAESSQRNSTSATQPCLRVDAAHAAPGRLATFHFGRDRLAVPFSATEDRDLVTARLGELAEAFDFQEPFERIREAIEEARRGG